MNHSPHQRSWQSEFMQLMTMTRLRMAALSRSYIHDVDEGVRLEDLFRDPSGGLAASHPAPGSGAESQPSN